MVSSSLRTVALAALLALTVGAQAAHAAFTVDTVRAEPANTAASTFGDFTIEVNFPGDSTAEAMTIDLAAGNLAVLQALTPCARSEVQADRCGAASQLGTVSAVVKAPILGNITAPGSIYVIPAEGSEIGGLGVVVRPPIGDKLAMFGTIRLRTDGDYGVRAQLNGLPDEATLSVPLLGKIPLAITLRSMRMTLLGRTADGRGAGLTFNTADCGSIPTRVEATGHNGQTSADTASYTASGCDRSPFGPALEIGPAHAAAAQPTDFQVTMRQSYRPTDAAVFAPFANGELLMPQGISLSAAINADGQLVGCDPAAFALGSGRRATCPAGSQVGSVAAATPMLPALPGKVFLAQPAPGDDPGDVARLLVEIEQGTARDSLRVKFAMRIAIQAGTGRVRAILENLPKLPVSSFAFTFPAGSTPVIRQPRTCGAFEGQATMRPHGAGGSRTFAAPYLVDRNCGPVTDEPSLTVSPKQVTAAASAPLGVAMRFPNGRAPAERLRVSLPQGLVAMLSRVPLCTLDRARAGTCPESSRLGSVRATSGQVDQPTAFTGDVYLAEGTGPDAIASLAVALPVVVGPIDLGTVTTVADLRVRDDVGVDVDAVMPQDVRGIPLDLRDLAIAIDRPSFTRMPSACGNAAVGLQVQGEQPSQASDAMTIDGCGSLPFTPSMRFASGPTAALAPDGHPDLTVTVAPGEGGGAPRALTTVLPAGLLVDLARINQATCPDVASVQNGTCTRAPIGTVQVQTPVLSGAVTGSIYAATVPGRSLPAVVMHVRDRVRLDLVGRTTTTAESRLSVAFDSIPDVPMERISITLPGGPSGVLRAGAELCTPAGTTGNASITAHHGAAVAITAPNERTCGAPLAARALAVTGSVAMVRRGNQFGIDARMSAGGDARRFVIVLPSGAGLSAGAARRLSVRGPGGEIDDAVVRASGRTLTIVVSEAIPRIAISGGAGTITVRRTLATALGRASSRARLAATGRVGAEANAVSASGPLAVRYLRR